MHSSLSAEVTDFIWSFTGDTQNILGLEYMQVGTVIGDAEHWSDEQDHPSTQHNACTQQHHRPFNIPCSDWFSR